MRCRSSNCRTWPGLLAALLLAGGCSAPTATEEAYPSRPIKLIVPFSAGGGTDTFARIFKAAVDKYQTLPQPLVVVNLNGAGATIGSRRVKDAVPDGYTVLILHEALITAKYAGTVNYGPEAFEPVAQTGEIGMVIAVAEDSPYSDLSELLGAASAEPDSVLFAANLGAPSHFAGLLLERTKENAAFRYTQYGGGADRFAAIKGGHVATSAFSLAEYVRFQPAGLRALAFLGTRRHESIPDVPTAREQGFDYVSNNIMMWWVPKGTPPERIRVLAEGLYDTMQTEDVRAKLAELQYEPTYAEGAELAELVQRLNNEVARVRPRKPVGLPNIPLLVGVCVVGMSFVVGVQTWRARVSNGIRLSFGQMSDVRRLLWTVAILTAYVTVLSTELAHFTWATFVFVVSITLAMVYPERPAWLRIVLVAGVLSFGIEQLFSRVLQVMLP